MVGGYWWGGYMVRGTWWGGTGEGYMFPPGLLLNARFRVRILIRVSVTRMLRSIPQLGVRGYGLWVRIRDLRTEPSRLSRMADRVYPYTLIPVYPYTLIPLYPYTLIPL